jgi:hypothetical protein
VVEGDPSPGLSTTPGTEVEGSVSCGEEGKFLGRGYVINGTGTELANVLARTVWPDPDGSGCVVSIQRTSNVGATPGVTISAVAICRP